MTVEFSYNGETYIGIILREYGAAYYILTKEKENYDNQGRATRYWTVRKSNVHAQFGRTEKIFKLLYS